MEYRVISNSSLENLQKTIEANLASGWRLQGGIAVSEKGFFQAIVREIKK